MQLARALIVGVFVIPLAMRWGVMGGALAVVLSSLSMLVVWYARTTELLKPRIRDWIGAFGPPIIGSVSLVGSICLYRRVTEPLLLGGAGAQIVWFVSAVCVALAVYVSAFGLSEPLLSEYSVVREVARAIRS